MFRDWRVPGYIAGDSCRLLRGDSASPSRSEVSLTTRLDAIDRKILKELQDDGRMTNVELARRVGISAPSQCLLRAHSAQALTKFP